MILEDAISAERLATYKAWAQQNDDDAMALYALNVAISESFYTALHCLEITLRNSVHNQMTALHGNGWFNNPAVVTDQYQQRKIADAISRLGGQAHGGQIIAELTFGFWTALFGKHNNHLWGQTLRPMFSAPVQRKQIAKRLNDIRRLRNRIAHHEPIIQQDLIIIHQEIQELTGWMSVEALAWCNARCRFLATHPGLSIIIATNFSCR